MVETQGNRPLILIARGRQTRIVQIQDIWRIDDEWWHRPISRYYYQVVLADGTSRAIYHDLIAGSWYAQAY